MSDHNQEHPAREHLERTIPFRGYVALGFGVIVGIGWVVYSGEWIRTGGPMGAILAFLLGGLFLLPVARCYAELTSSMPLAGGEVAFTYKAFNSHVAFLTAWGLALNYTTVTPYETIAIGTLTETIFPSLKSAALYTIGDDRIALSNMLPGILSAICITTINVRGAKDSAKLQAGIVYLLLAATVGFVATALIKGNVSNLMPLFSHEGSLWIAAPTSIIGVLVVVPFFLAGFDAIPQAAEEAGIKVAPRKLGIAILASIIAGSLFYGIIILSVGLSMPWQQSVDLPMTSAAVFREALGYEWAADLVLFAALMGLVSTFNGITVAASRLLFALGRGGMLPHWFAYVHPRFHTPSNAVLFVGLISLIGPFVGMAGLGPIVSCGAFAFSAALLLSCLSALRLRKIAPDLDRPYRATRADMVIGTVVTIGLLVLMIAPWSPGRLGSVEWIIIAAWMVLGIAFYIARQKLHPLSREEQDHLVLGPYK